MSDALDHDWNDSWTASGLFTPSAEKPEAERMIATVSATHEYLREAAGEAIEALSSQ